MQQCNHRHAGREGGETGWNGGTRTRGGEAYDSSQGVSKKQRKRRQKRPAAAGADGIPPTQAVHLHASLGRTFGKGEVPPAPPPGFETIEPSSDPPDSASGAKRILRIPFISEAVAVDPSKCSSSPSPQPLGDSVPVSAPTPTPIPAPHEATRPKSADSAAAMHFHNETQEQKQQEDKTFLRAEHNFHRIWTASHDGRPPRYRPPPLMFPQPPDSLSPSMSSSLKDVLKRTPLPDWPLGVSQEAPSVQLQLPKQTSATRVAETASHGVPVRPDSGGGGEGVQQRSACSPGPLQGWPSCSLQQQMTIESDATTRETPKEGLKSPPERSSVDSQTAAAAAASLDLTALSGWGEHADLCAKIQRARQRRECEAREIIEGLMKEEAGESLTLSASEWEEGKGHRFTHSSGGSPSGGTPVVHDPSLISRGTEPGKGSGGLGDGPGEISQGSHSQALTVGTRQEKGVQTQESGGEGSLLLPSSAVTSLSPPSWAENPKKPERQVWGQNGGQGEQVDHQTRLSSPCEQVEGALEGGREGGGESQREEPSRVSHGNFACQILFEACKKEKQRAPLLEKLLPHAVMIACDPKGTHALQSLIGKLSTVGEEEALVAAFLQRAVETAKDPCGTRVIQRLVSVLFPQSVVPLVESLVRRLGDLLVLDNPHGAYVCEKILHLIGLGKDGKRDGRKVLEVQWRIVETLQRDLVAFLKTKHGSPFVKHALKKWGCDELPSRRLVEVLCGHMQMLSVYPFCQEIVECCMDTSDKDVRDRVIRELTLQSHLPVLFRDEAAAQKLLNKATAVASAERRKRISQAVVRLQQQLKQRQKEDSNLGDSLKKLQNGLLSQPRCSAQKNSANTGTPSCAPPTGNSGTFKGSASLHPREKAVPPPHGNPGGQPTSRSREGRQRERPRGGNADAIAADQQQQVRSVTEPVGGLPATSASPSPLQGILVPPSYIPHISTDPLSISHTQTVTRLPTLPPSHGLPSHSACAVRETPPIVSQKDPFFYRQHQHSSAYHQGHSTREPTSLCAFQQPPLPVIPQTQQQSGVYHKDYRIVEVTEEERGLPGRGTAGREHVLTEPSRMQTLEGHSNCHTGLCRLALEVERHMRGVRGEVPLQAPFSTQPSHPVPASLFPPEGSHGHSRLTHADANRTCPPEGHPAFPPWPRTLPTLPSLPSPGVHQYRSVSETMTLQGRQPIIQSQRPPTAPPEFPLHPHPFPVSQTNAQEHLQSRGEPEMHTETQTNTATPPWAHDLFPSGMSTAFPSPSPSLHMPQPSGRVTVRFFYATDDPAALSRFARMVSMGRQQKPKSDRVVGEGNGASICKPSNVIFRRLKDTPDLVWGREKDTKSSRKRAVSGDPFHCTGCPSFNASRKASLEDPEILSQTERQNQTEKETETNANPQQQGHTPTEKPLPTAHTDAHTDALMLFLSGPSLSLSGTRALSPEEKPRELRKKGASSAIPSPGEVSRVVRKEGEWVHALLLLGRDLSRV
uniref:PUM-HD domain-containing protein n=1 Tax=Chromera velia CCMP2878 TaxID=1169474 RepID=A0A0G4I3G4_9ALVE|eukprot:Cvel_10669.t1-p1 / transcript=Cvel_10669.t1 / gene=Cvel_10669 / organism=Chromera_velia_CCMP2878 / gene_product=Pumilio domain-containing protein C4G8.03c, putative / transcript_product=Pumilio domain-containing protein C4G8.03c, putative / location=Cvel_scaffold648:57655-66608(+) / protein_length=1480 / sequence_SO=supercontig / SO=protein_coding / is_pseudo=false